MSKEILALGLTVLVHVIGIIALVWALLLEEENRPDWRGWWPRDDDDPPAPEARPGSPGGRLPLPDGAQSVVRLREPSRLADAHPRAPRRPEHAPRPVAPERAPAGE